MSDHANKHPKINWNRGQPMTDEEFVALAAKCLLWHHPFQEATFFNEDSWLKVGTHGMEPATVSSWTQNTLESFKRANLPRDRNRRIQKFLHWLKDKKYIHNENFDPTSPNWEVSLQYITELIEAIENPESLASKIFGSCDVFISHASGDPKAAELYKVLKEDYNLNVFMTPELDDIAQGADWPTDITGHLKGARVVVIVLTQSSKNRPAVNQEIGFALGYGCTRIVWFDTPNPGHILLPSTTQECAMSKYDAQQLAKLVHDRVMQSR